MSTSGFDASDLSDLENQLLRLAAKQYPKEAKSFLRTQGNKAKTRLRNRTKSVTKRKRAISSGESTKAPRSSMRAAFRSVCTTRRPMRT